MSEYVTREEHKEFATRIEEQERRQDRRLDKLEETVERINSLAVTMERLTANMESLAASTKTMAGEMQSQSARLDAIEKEPANNWKNAVWIVISALIAAAVGALMRGLV